jgi:uncharacterized protein YbcV (DUF1398 family)
MTAAVQSVVDACNEGSENNTLTFPQQLQKLRGAGIEGYYADLRRNRKIYYAPDGESYKANATPLGVAIPERFDAASIAAAVKQSQAGKLTYKDFCKTVMAVGCACYVVSILGKRVVYMGRTGETHIEPFPDAK